jgi:cell division protease FtsH
VVAILKESYEKALELLRENREVMDKLAEFLIEKETITGKEFMEIFRKEKGLPEPSVEVPHEEPAREDLGPKAWDEEGKEKRKWEETLGRNSQKEMTWNQGL